jgi:hypothetical protein
MDCAIQSDTIDMKMLENITDGNMNVTSTKPTPKLSNMDLSFMLNWDSSTRRKSEGDERQADTDTQYQASSEVRTPTMESIEEGPSNGSTASLVTTTIHSGSTKINENQHSDPTTKTAHGGHVTQHSSRSDCAREMSQSSATESNDFQPPAKPEKKSFLPPNLHSNDTELP